MPAPAPRHCMVVDNQYPDIRVEREANALLERGYRVDVICLRSPGKPRTERIGRLTIHRLPITRRRGAGAAAQLWEYLTFTAWATAMVTLRQLRAPYDVVQVHNVPDFLVFSAVVPKLQGAAVILDLHDLMPEFFASRFGGGLQSPLARAVLLQERLSTAFADQVITVTDLWRARLMRRGIHGDKVHVVMNVPDERAFPIREPTVRRTDGPLTVIYHGTVTRRYGIDVLLMAFAIARQRVPLRLLIHGRGEYMGEAQELANQLGMADAVTFSKSLLSTSELSALVTEADIGVVPNRNDLFTDDILPTKLMEYAALGIPSIVSRSTAVESQFTDEMVRFVEPANADELADAMVELAVDPDLRATLASGAQRFSRQFRWADQAAEYVALVDRLARQVPGQWRPHDSNRTPRCWAKRRRRSSGAPWKPVSLRRALAWPSSRRASPSSSAPGAPLAVSSGTTAPFAPSLCWLPASAQATRSSPSSFHRQCQRRSCTRARAPVFIDVGPSQTSRWIPSQIEECDHAALAGSHAGQHLRGEPGRHAGRRGITQPPRAAPCWRMPARLMGHRSTDAASGA